MGRRRRCQRERRHRKLWAGRVPRHPDSRKKGQGRAAPGGVLHGRDCPLETAFDPWSVMGDIASDDPRASKDTDNDTLNDTA
eukprot:scaffold18529_cov62-Phaeocystis_antarctica.AAC.3